MVAILEREGGAGKEMYILGDTSYGRQGNRSEKHCLWLDISLLREWGNLLPLVTLQLLCG